MKSDLILDTNILIDTYRNYKPAKDFLTTLEDLNVSVFTCFELIQGTLNMAQLIKTLKDLDTLNVLNIDIRIQNTALELYKAFKLKYTFGIADSIIAATCIEYNMTLVTRNIKHYHFIKELRLYNPY